MYRLQQMTGDLWEQHQNGHVIAITTGGLVRKDGTCVMPSGTALQAARKFPQLPGILGQQIRQKGMHVFELENRIVSFPVENSPYENPELSIIRQSCLELVELAESKGWTRIVVPRPGCGHGGLSWNEVQPILANYFDKRFIVITEEKKHETD